MNSNLFNNTLTALPRFIHVALMGYVFFINVFWEFAFQKFPFIYFFQKSLVLHGPTVYM